MISGDMAEHLRRAACGRDMPSQRRDSQRPRRLARTAAAGRCTQRAERAGRRSRRRRRTGSRPRCRVRARAAPSTGSLACGPRNAMRTTAWPAGAGSGHEPRSRARPAGVGRLVGEEGARDRMLRAGEDIEHVAAARRCGRPRSPPPRRRSARITDISWVISTMVRPSSRLMRRSRSRIERVVSGSSAEVASSDSSTLRPRRQRAGDADALLLAAGEFGRIAVALVGEADQVEQFGDAAPDRRPWRSPRFRAAGRCCRPPCARTAG